METLAYCPALQLVQEAAPDVLYVPGGQAVPVDDVDPAGHMYPAVQVPLQLALSSP